ncbi:hypothetical protein MMC06_000450 [Schaereria dolodes]|nr:hypothetical protein [Schaereria dolodes]
MFASKLTDSTPLDFSDKRPRTSETLPHPSFNRSSSEAPILTANSNTVELAQSPQSPSIFQPVSFQRPRKRVVWRNKICVIALPLKNSKYTDAFGSGYLKPKDVFERLAKWESQGFDTRGFILTKSPTQLSIGADGQTCSIFPDSNDWLQEWQNREYRVSIPDRHAWETYVDQLKEEKLRALGVSFGDEELQPKESPTWSSMSRQTSSQISIHASSLRAAVSANSLMRGEGPMNPFSPPFIGSPAADVPLALPAAPSAHYVAYPESLHHSRRSVAFRDEQSLRRGFQSSQPQQAPTSSVGWPRQQYSGLQSGPRGVSPATNGQTPSESASFSTVSPSLADLRHEAVQPELNSLLAQMRQQQTDLQTQLLYQQHQQQQQLNPFQLPKTGDVSHHRDELYPTKFVSQPEIASPLPQGHHHNLSESLQKEIDDAEYHLEESIRRQLDEDDEQTILSEKEDGNDINLCQSNDINSREAIFDPNKRSIENISDLDTNPSITGTPEASERPQVYAKLPYQQHKSMTSASRFNANAQEFIYEPKAPNMFAFSGNMASAPQSTTVFMSDTQAVHTRQTSKFAAAAVVSKLNVTAPTFTPGNPSKAPAPAPRREFSFSSTGPKCKPDAPVFKPISTSYKRMSSNEASGADVPPTKIFKNIDFSEIIKPVQKSRAIPIISPDTSGADLDGQEDESGRITQPDGRQKRMRRDDHDEEHQVPRFATPSPEEPLGLLRNQSTAGKKFRALSENFDSGASPLERATGQLREIVNGFGFSALDVSSIIEGQPSQQKLRGPNDSFEFENVEEAANFNVALPPSPTSTRSATSRANEQSSGLLEDVDNEHENPARLSRPPVYTHLHERELDSATVFAKPSQHDQGLDPRAFALRHSLGSRSPISAPSPVAPQHPPPSSLNGNTIRPFEQVPKSRSNILEGVSYIDPSYDELDAVMKHLNEEDSDFGIERAFSPKTQPYPSRTSVFNVDTNNGMNNHFPQMAQRSDSALQSPRMSQLSFTHMPQREYESPDSADVELIARNACFSPSYKLPQRSGSPVDYLIHRLNSSDNVPISDWDDAVSPTDKVELQSRSGFFDHRVNDLIGSVIQQRLGPVESSLATMHDVLTKISGKSASSMKRRSVSAEAEHSDADDEDDDDRASQAKSRSPLKDRKFDKLRESLLNAITATHQSTNGGQQSTILETLADMKTTILEQSSIASNDIKTAVEQAVARQLRGKSSAITSTHESATAEKSQLQITGLESMLKVAEDRAEDELRARRLAEDALADSQRNLRIAQLEAAEQRESAEETERSLRAFHEERQQAMRRTIVLEGAQETLQTTVSDLSEKNAALEETLEEYRLSSAQWRAEIDEAKVDNKNLKRTIHALKSELEEGIRGRHALRNKFDRLQEEMSIAARDIASDQSSWRRREEEHKTKYESLTARLNAEVRIREHHELSIERLEFQEKEMANDKFKLQQIERECFQLTTLTNKLRAENHEQQDLIARHKLELHTANKTCEMELIRTRQFMGAEAEIAKREVDVVRANLESDIEKLRSQLEDANQEATAVKARHEVMLDEASESRSNALRDAAEAREAALREHYRFHERTLEELKIHHGRALSDVSEDKQRLQKHFSDRLALFEEKEQHYQGRVSHLEEKLEIAKSAAHAAVQAAHSAKILTAPSSRPSAPIENPSDLPEKVSPQALRESILVLQEQLQEREGHIEQLEKDLAKIDQNAPQRIKDRDIEITWLRELLGVRVDDLQDLILTLSQESYDRDAVRDAAIRLKANLQMEQHEKERLMGGGQTFPSLASITNLAASPRALPLVAAAAWGNWRKAREVSSSFMNGGNSQTPSKSSSQSFLSGLLTPPNTSIRKTPESSSGQSSSKLSSLSARPLRSYTTPRRSLPYQSESRPFMQQEPPVTPSLLRTTSYDQDAESPHYSLERYVDEDESVEGIETTPRQADDEDGPFGPSIRA